MGQRSPKKNVEGAPKEKVTEGNKFEPDESEHLEAVSPLLQLDSKGQGKEKYEEEDSPVSSVAEDLDNDNEDSEVEDGDNDQNDLDDIEDGGNDFEERKVSARRLRRRQMHQAKKAADKAAKMAKTRRKTESEEPDEKPDKEHDKSGSASTGDSGQEKEPGSDSEWEREMMRAKRMAKLEAERALAQRSFG